MARYDVFRTGDAGHAAEPLGQAEVASDGQISLLNARPGAEAELDRAFADLNGRDGLVMKLPPEPDDPKYAIVKKKIPRDDPAFFDAIQDNLRRWHNMTLSPAE